MMWKDLPTPCYVAGEKKVKRKSQDSSETGEGHGLSCVTGTEGVFHVFSVPDDWELYQRNHGQRAL